MDTSVKVAPGALNCSTGLGEGPHWDGDKEELLYVDLTGQGVLRYVPKTKECYRVQIDKGWVSVIVPVAGQPNKYLLCIDRTLQIMEWDGKSATPGNLKLIHTVDAHETGNWFNDGKCDASGRFWGGTVGHYHFDTGKVDPKKGTLYSMDKVGKVKDHVNEIDFSNGLTWSPDNSIMYYNDSYSTGLYAFDFDIVEGTLSNRRTVFDFKATNTEGVPDGMTIDSNGNLWIALFGGEGVIKVDPETGKRIGCVKIPTKRATCPTFGGPNLDVLYITTAGAFMPNDKVGEDWGAIFQAENIGAKGVSSGIRYAGKV